MSSFKASSEREIEHREEGCGKIFCRFLFESLGLRGLAAVALSLFGGVCSAVSLNCLGRHLAGNPPPEQIAWLAAWIFAAFVLELMAKRLFIQLSTQATWSLRSQLARQILHRPFVELERIGTSRLLAALTDDVAKIAGVMGILPAVFVAIPLGAGCFVSLAYLSPWLLGALCAIAVPAGWIGLMLHRRAKQCVAEAFASRDETFEHLRSLTDGVKELKLHTARREEFLDQMLEPALANTRIQTSSARQWDQLVVTVSQAGMLLLLLGVLIASRWVPVNPVTSTTFAIVLLYVRSSLLSLLNVLPAWSEASMAVVNLTRLGFNLSHPSSRQPDLPHGSAKNEQAEVMKTAKAKAPEIPEEFNASRTGKFHLELADLCYSHKNDSTAPRDATFSLGPIDLSIRSGEVIFLVGGNGSGKTTLMKLLIGLYVPEAGSIRLNGISIDDQNREAYLQHFSVIFADFHLFERMLGMNAEDLDRSTDGLLDLLKLSGHVTLSNGLLSTTQLSHGQRQRLALLTAFLEDRPIYVFDEWAANQDPHFREIFYRQIIPDLKSRGKLVIVISHDGRYFDVADQLVLLDEGIIKTSMQSTAA